nr:zinc finger, CCHC-type [Tanacetum cinerariifolium]
MSAKGEKIEKAQKKNDVKERSMLLMALPNKHLMTFNQYKDAKTLFAAIQTTFGGNEATKKTQKTLLKQMYENFSAFNTESFDFIFNRLQKIVNTMIIDDLYNNFKIIEQEVKGTASSSSSSQDITFVSSPSSTNEVNTAYGVSTANTHVTPASTQVSTASTQVSIANLSDATVYAFLASQPNVSQLAHEDLVQIHEDDLKEMDLKWQLALLNMRTRRNQDSKNKNQDNSRRTVNVEDTSSNAMVAIDGAGFDWSYMADDEVPTNMALMAFSNSKKPEGSEGFHQIVDFINTSHIRYALIENPTIYVSLIQQFWQTATASTLDNGEMEIIATIDGKVKGEGSTLPFESYHTPTGAPSTSRPHLLPTPRSSIRQETEVPQPSSPPHTNVANEDASTGVDVRHGGAATTVKKLEKTLKISQARRRAKIIVSDAEEDLEDLSKQGRKIDEIDQDYNISLIQHDAKIQGRYDQDMKFNFDFDDAKVDVSPASPTRRVYTADDITMAETLVYIRRSAAKDKETTSRERNKYSEVDLAKMLVDLINQRKQYFAAQKAKAKRNKPMTQAQQRTYMSNYIKHMGSHKLQQLRGYSFDELKTLFETTMRRVNTFIPMETEDRGRASKLAAGSLQATITDSVEVRISKRVAEAELDYEGSKRQKTNEASGLEQPDEEENELLQEDLQQMMMVVPVEEVYVESLQVKYPITDWERIQESLMKLCNLCDVAFWKEAINVEMDFIMDNNTWTLSDLPSEFEALAAAGKEAEWLRNLIYEIPLWPKPISPISVHCDSATTLAKVYCQIYNEKSRHLGVRHNMIRELIINGVIFVNFVRFQQNMTDHLTKGLARDLVHKLAIGMGLKFVNISNDETPNSVLANVRSRIQCGNLIFSDWSTIKTIIPKYVLGSVD